MKFLKTLFQILQLCPFHKHVRPMSFPTYNLISCFLANLMLKKKKERKLSKQKKNVQNVENMTDAHQNKWAFGTIQSELQICSHTKPKWEKSWKCKRHKIGRDFHFYAKEAEDEFIEYRLCEERHETDNTWACQVLNQKWKLKKSLQGVYR